jgi:hypothetical protein
MEERPMRVDRWAFVLLSFVSCEAWAQNVQSSPQIVSGQKPFPDFEFLPSPENYSGRVFRLSQQYPSELPPADRIPEFFKIDFRTNWRDYLMAARDYCFKGNITPGGNVEDDWRVADARPPRWFHMPWQTYGPYGREGVHGLTKEAPIQPRQLAWTQTYQGGQTFAVGFFNEFAGYTIGQVWSDHNNPELGKATFPNGAVLCKILFVDVPVEQVPFLGNPLQWCAYVTASYTAPPTAHRVFKKLSLVQMDLAVRDERAPLKWIFGNYQYNGAMKRANPWENLVPLGIQWGNDPDITENASNPMPVATLRNLQLKETIINDDANELPPTHLGWNGRLCGPVDNPMSSCMSCHSTAQYPVLSPQSPLFQDTPPAPSSASWMRWFRNIPCAVPFDQDPRDPTHSTDYSLQLADSVQNFRAWHEEERARSASDYKPSATEQPCAGEPDSHFKLRAHGKRQYKILRGPPPDPQGGRGGPP